MKYWEKRKTDFDSFWENGGSTTVIDFLIN